MQLPLSTFTLDNGWKMHISRDEISKKKKKPTKQENITLNAYLLSHYLQLQEPFLVYNLTHLSEFEFTKRTL